MTEVELQFGERRSERINQGSINQAALAKGQRKMICISSSANPHLAQRGEMCLDLAAALAPDGIALRRILLAKVLTLRIISLHFHTEFSSC